MYLLILLFSLLSFSISSHAQAAHVITTDHGTVVVPYSGQRGQIRHHTLDDPQVLWSRIDISGIFISASISDSQYAYSGSWLSSAQAAQYQILGDGTPQISLNGFEWEVAASPDGAYWAAVNLDTSNICTLYFMSSASQTPVWTYALGIGGVAGTDGLQFSHEGGVLVLFMSRQTGSTPLLLAWNVSNPDSVPILNFEIPTGEGAGARALEITSDGTLIACTADNYCHVVETQTGIERGVIDFQASTDGLALSADGNWIMSGFQTVHMYHWNGSAYQAQWLSGIAGRYVSQLAISPDESYAVSCWYSSTYNRNYIRVHDMAIGTPIWNYLYNQDTGQLQDWPIDIDMSADGNWFVVGSWGDAGNSNGEAVVFSRYYPTPYYQLDMSGSCWAVDLTDNGNYLIAAGKHIHANQFGGTGDLYLVDLDLPPLTPLPGAVDPGLTGPDVMCNCLENPILSVSLYNHGYAPFVLDSITWTRFQDEDNSTLGIVDSSIFHAGIAPGDTLLLQFAFHVCDGNFNELGYHLFHFSLHSPDTTLDLPFATILEWCSGANDRQMVTPKYELSDTYPNPFNSTAAISFSLPHAANVRIGLTDILGREVKTLADQGFTMGNHQISLNAGDLPSGMYFLTLNSQFGTRLQKLLLLK